MLHLSKPDYLRALLRRSRWEFAIALVVIAGELGLGILQGIGLGVVLSLLLLIYRASHPHGAALGQLPGTEAYRFVGRHPEAITFPGILLWRLGGDLFFASIGKVEDDLKAALSIDPVRHLLLDAEGVSFIDTSAADALLALLKDMRGQGLSIVFARVRDSVRDEMRRSGVEAVVGPANFFDRITDGVRALQSQLPRRDQRG
jgi:anti-anti-sigma factor